jgi:hypothetical protein
MIFMPKMSNFFNFPYADATNPPKGGVTYNNLEKYLDEAVDGINNKFKIVKNGKVALKQMVDEGTLSADDMQETIKTRQAIADRTVQIYKEIMKKEDYTPEMKENLRRKINKVRVLMFFQMLREDGELESDAATNKAFLEEITSEAS